MTAADRIRIRLTEAQACRAAVTGPCTALSERVATWRAALEEALAADPAAPLPSPAPTIAAAPAPMPAIPVAGAQEAETQAPALDPAPRRRARQSVLFPAERQARMNALWCTPIHVDALIQDLNTLPGPPLEHPRQLYTRARDLGLPERPRVLSEEAKAAMAARNAARNLSFSAERDEALRQGWAANDAPGVILAAVNALPGPAIVSVGTINNRARALNLPKRDLAKQLASERMRAIRARQIAAGDQMWTPERIQALRDGYARGDDDDTLLTTLEAMPGLAIGTRQRVQLKRSKLGLVCTPTPPPAASQPAAEAPAPEAAPAPAPEPTPAPPPKPQPIAAPPPEAPEARRARQDDVARGMLRDGMADTLIRQHTGLDLVRIAELAAEVAAEADSAQAKRLAKARKMLREKTEPTIVTAHTRLPLREVFRLQAELRREGAAA